MVAHALHIEFAQGVVVLPHLVEHDRQIEPRLHVIRIQLERPPELLGRVPTVAVHAQRQAELIVKIREIRIEPHRFEQFSNGVLVEAPLEEVPAEQYVPFGRDAHSLPPWTAFEPPAVVPDTKRI